MDSGLGQESWRRPSRRIQNGVVGDGGSFELLVEEFWFSSEAASVPSVYNSATRSCQGPSDLRPGEHVLFIQWQFVQA